MVSSCLATATSGSSLSLATCLRHGRRGSRLLLAERRAALEVGGKSERAALLRSERLDFPIAAVIEWSNREENGT